MNYYTDPNLINFKNQFDNFKYYNVYHVKRIEALCDEIIDYIRPINNKDKRWLKKQLESVTKAAFYYFESGETETKPAWYISVIGTAESAITEYLARRS